MTEGDFHVNEVQVNAPGFQISQAIKVNRTLFFYPVSPKNKRDLLLKVINPQENVNRMFCTVAQTVGLLRILLNKVKINLNLDVQYNSDPKTVSVSETIESLDRTDELPCHRL